MRCMLASACNDLYLDKPGDDTTVAAIKIREPLQVNIMVGPPVDRESDDFYVSRDSPGEDITFRAYNPRTLQVQETMTPFSIPFDGESHGTPSKPIELRFE